MENSMGEAGWVGGRLLAAKTNRLPYDLMVCMDDGCLRGLGDLGCWGGLVGG